MLKEAEQEGKLASLVDAISTRPASILRNGCAHGAGLGFDFNVIDIAVTVFLSVGRRIIVVAVDAGSALASFGVVRRP